MRHAIPIILALLLLGALAPTLPAQATGRTLEAPVYLHEPLHLVPERFDAKVGDTITMVVRNPNPNPHDLLMCGDVPDGDSSCTDKWGFVALAAGESRNLTFVVKKAGTFEYYCSIPGHKQGGMRGEMRVLGEPEGKKTPGVGLASFGLTLLIVALVARRPRSEW